VTPPDRDQTAVDLHSHLVPGVDDGARTVDDVLEGVSRMADRGIGHIVTTPHLEGSLTLMPERFEARMDEMDRAFARGRAAVRESLPDMAFSRANEVALDHPEPDLSDPRLQLERGGYVLVEWPRLRVPPESPRVLERVGGQGVGLLLAHPERYRLGDRALERMSQWREAGAHFQVNYGSLVGVYGPEARKNALELLARGWVECLATDFHGRAGLRLFISEARDHFRVRDGEPGPEAEAWHLLTRTNPRRFLEGEAPVPVPPVGRGETLWGRLTSLFR